MNVAAQPMTEEDAPLSPWWIRGITIVMVFGFSVLIGITMLAYRNAPPIPAQVVDAQGVTLFSGDDISDGQTFDEYTKNGCPVSNSDRPTRGQRFSSLPNRHNGFINAH